MRKDSRFSKLLCRQKEQLSKRHSFIQGIFHCAFFIEALAPVDEAVALSAEAVETAVSVLRSVLQ